MPVAVATAVFATGGGVLPAPESRTAGMALISFGLAARITLVAFRLTAGVTSMVPVPGTLYSVFHFPDYTIQHRHHLSEGVVSLNPYHHDLTTATLKQAETNRLPRTLPQRNLHGAYG